MNRNQFRILHHLLAGLLALMTSAGVGLAQQWQARTSDEGTYAAGFVRYPGLDMSIYCAARSVQNRPLMQGGWHETVVAPPWHFQITFDPTLVPFADGGWSDLVLYVGDTGYRLPHTEFDEFEGLWKIDLQMTDRLFAALRAAPRLVLAVGALKSWELPTRNLGPALQKAQAHCGATWQVTGFPAPAGLRVQAAPAVASPKKSGFQLPPQILTHVNATCGGFGAINHEGLQAGDLDGDGHPDVLLNYRDVQCAGGTIGGMCGAANCSIEVFLSSRRYANPVSMLGIDGTIMPQPNGRLAIQIVGTYSLCGQSGCDEPFYWDGQDFSPLK